MRTDPATRIVREFELGRLSRRQLIVQLMALGAVTGRAQTPAPTFQSTGLDHVALRVTDVGRSVEFYQKHLGLTVTSRSESSAFLDTGDAEFLALFRGGRPGLAHYCYSIRDYDAESAVETLTAAGLQPRRSGNRVYFDDPDGIEVQLAG